MRPITVVVADDDTHIRDLLRLRLDLDGRFDVVGEAGDGEEALQMLRHYRPDVVVLDIGMPRMTGLEVLEHLRTELPEVKVVLFTSLRDPAMQDSPEAAAAHAYLEKGDIVGSLIPTLVRLTTPETG